MGYADPDVDAAVMAAIQKGVSSTLNCPEEVALAQLMVQLHPWAQRVRFARSGGEAMSVAIRIARAFTKKDIVLFSGYHGWTDWYLAALLHHPNALDKFLMPGLKPYGLPKALKGTSISFPFDDIEGLKKLLDKNKNKVAAIVLEPAQAENKVAILKQIRTLATEHKAVLIFDEITSGFRMSAGGIHLNYKVNPDMAVFAKAMANGYAMSAVIGRDKVMLGACETFISSTNWTERVGPSAALATIHKIVRKQVPKHLMKIGGAVRNVWLEKASKHHLDLTVSGFPSLVHFHFDHPQRSVLNTYFVMEMLKRGFLAFCQFKPSYAHTDKEVSRYAKAVDEIFELIAKSDPKKLLKQNQTGVGFYRLTR